MNFEEYFKTRLDKGEYLTSNIGQRALEEGWIACKKNIYNYLKLKYGSFISDEEHWKILEEIEKL